MAGRAGRPPAGVMWLLATSRGMLPQLWVLRRASRCSLSAIRSRPRFGIWSGYDPEPKARNLIVGFETRNLNDF